MNHVNFDFVNFDNVNFEEGIQYLLEWYYNQGRNRGYVVQSNYNIK